MFIIRVSQKVYFNKFSNKDIYYNIENYYKNFNIYYFVNFFVYYINNKKQFYNVYKNKSSKNENKTKFKNDIKIKFVVIFYYIIINKINKKLTYRKY